MAICFLCFLKEFERARNVRAQRDSRRFTRQVQVQCAVGAADGVEVECFASDASCIACNQARLCTRTYASASAQRVTRTRLDPPGAQATGNSSKLGFQSAVTALEPLENGSVMADLPVYSAADVAAHNSEGDLWMIIKGKVYDVTNYLAEHPGGDIMLEGAGKDATTLFVDTGHSPEAEAILGRFLIGTLSS